jgi:hypothetical protein
MLRTAYQRPTPAQLRKAAAFYAPVNPSEKQPAARARGPAEVVERVEYAYPEPARRARPPRYDR